MKKLLILSFITTFLWSSYALGQETAETKETKTSSKKAVDPFGVSKDRRESAELPIPYGIIGSFTFGAVKSADAAHLFSGSVYYDNYQLSYKNLGGGVPVIEFMSRTNNRDCYKGIGIQFGTYTQEFHDADGHYDEARGEYVYDSIVTKNDLTYWGASYTYWSTYTNEVSTIYGWDASFGIGSGTNKATNKSISDVNFMAGGGVGWRIPMGISGLTFGFKYWAGFSPRLSKLSTDEFGDDVHYGVGAFATVGLGFDK
jgi:hypothetical protein